MHRCCASLAPACCDNARTADHRARLAPERAPAGGGPCGSIGPPNGDVSPRPGHVPRSIGVFLIERDRIGIDHAVIGARTRIDRDDVIGERPDRSSGSLPVKLGIGVPGEPGRDAARQPPCVSCQDHRRSVAAGAAAYRSDTAGSPARTRSAHRPPRCHGMRDTASRTTRHHAPDRAPAVVRSSPRFPPSRRPRARMP